MAVFIVGDIHGCFDELRVLLTQAGLNKDRDQLMTTGDIVGRGPKSLDTIKFIRENGAVTVLGNHDLNAIACAMGLRKVKPSDRLDELLAAPGHEELIDWLRKRPVMYRLREQNAVLVHAGISPSWSVAEAESRARELEEVLRSDRIGWLLSNMYYDEPALWYPSSPGIKRLRYIVSAFTRMRMCYADDRLDFLSKYTPEDSAGTGLIPWYDISVKPAETVYFGHWAALQGKSDKKWAVALDTGCVWGGKLTVINLDSDKKTSVKAFSTYKPISKK